MKAEGAAGPLLRRAAGLQGPARAGRPQAPALREPRGLAGRHHRRERLGTRALAGLQRLRGRGRRDPQRGADLLRHAGDDPPPRRARARRPAGRRGHGHGRRPPAAREAPERGQALQAHLHHRQLPEPRGADHVAPPPRGADRAGARVRHADPRRRRLRRAALRGAGAPVALRARQGRPDHPRRHAVEDPGRGREARLALRAAPDDPGLPGLPLRRRRQPVHVARGDVLHAREPRAPRRAPRRHLPARSATRC